MSRFGRHGPPDIVDTYSLLVLNISFRTTADDLYPYFDRYGKVVDIFIPKDRRTGDSRGFAFVRYNYQDEAQMAVERLDGKVVDGREIMVQFAKYGPNAERISKGRIIEKVPRTSISRSRSPRCRSRDDYYRDCDYRRSSRSRSYDRYRKRERSSRRRSLSRSPSSDYDRRRSRSRYVNDGYRSRSRSRSCSYESDSPPQGKKSLSPRVSPDRRSYDERSPTSQSDSSGHRTIDSRTPPRNSE